MRLKRTVRVVVPSGSRALATRVVSPRGFQKKRRALRAGIQPATRRAPTRRLSRALSGHGRFRNGGVWNEKRASVCFRDDARTRRAFARRRRRKRSALHQPRARSRAGRRLVAAEGRERDQDHPRRRVRGRRDRRRRSRHRPRKRRILFLRRDGDDKGSGGTLRDAGFVRVRGGDAKNARVDVAGRRVRFGVRARRRRRRGGRRRPPGERRRVRRRG